MIHKIGVNWTYADIIKFIIINCLSYRDDSHVIYVINSFDSAGLLELLRQADFSTTNIVKRYSQRIELADSKLIRDRKKYHYYFLEQFKYNELIFPKIIEDEVNYYIFTPKIESKGPLFEYAKEHFIEELL